MEGVGSQKNRKESQDVPIQDFSPIGPATWLWNMENHKDRWKNTEKFSVLMPKTDTEDQMAAKNDKQESSWNGGHQ